MLCQIRKTFKNGHFKPYKYSKAIFFHQIIYEHVTIFAMNTENKAVQMVNLLVKYGGNEAGKGFMKLIGVDCGWFRAPLKPLSKKQLAGLKSDLKEIGFFDFCSKV